MHRLTTEEEKRKIPGEDVLNLFEVQDNYPEDRGRYEYLGKTSRGSTPLYINRRGFGSGHACIRWFHRGS